MTATSEQPTFQYDETIDELDPRVHARRWFTLGTLCISLLIIVMDNTILNVALPQLVDELGATNSQLQWIVDGYTLVFAGLLLTAGSLGDRFGRKLALRTGIIIFAIGSVLSALAGTPKQLIAARCLMGVGGALIMPSTLSILTNVFHDPRERGRAIAIWAGFSGLGRRHRPGDRRPPPGALLLGLGLPGQRPDRDHRRHPRRVLRPRVEGPDRATARPDRRRAVDRRPRRPAVRHHRSPHPRLGQRAGDRLVRRRRRRASSGSSCGSGTPTTRCST